MTDIAPELYDEITDEIEWTLKHNLNIQSIQRKIDRGIATHADTEAYSLQLGKITSKALLNHLTEDALPGGELYYNIATDTVERTLIDNLGRVNAVGSQIQTGMNEAAGFGLKAVPADLNADRIHDLVSNMADCNELERARELMGEPIINTTQSYADDFVAENAEFQANCGLAPKIVRTANAGCCDWCAELEGTYDYDDVGDDVYRRHENCRCVVEFFPHDGRGIQNAHTKEWRTDPDEIQTRRTYGL